jgi:hypothetical protein
MTCSTVSINMRIKPRINLNSNCLARTTIT